MIFQFNSYKLGEVNTSAPKPLVTQASRLSWVDHARGMAIMLVVYRHVVVGMQRADIAVSSLMYNIQEVFFNFRMPVFFVLSGVFVAGGLKKKTAGNIALNRVYTILYPYLLWACINILLQVCFSQFTNTKRTLLDLRYIITQPREVDHLWYLLALFNTSILYLLIGRVVKPLWLNVIIALGLHCLSFYLKDYSLFSDMFFYYGYFFTGVTLSQFLLDADKRENILATGNLKWVLPFFIAGQVFWFTHRTQEEIYQLLFFVINLVACYMVFILAKQISKSSRNNWLSYLGKHSLYIYILHVPIAAVIRSFLMRAGGNFNEWVFLFICWTGGLLIPIALYRSLKGLGFNRLFTLKPAATA